MTQTQLCFDNPTRVPPDGSQCKDLLLAFQRGEKLTVAVALEKYKVYALSQRCGELRRKYGWPILSRFITTSGGASVKEYYL